MYKVVPAAIKNAIPYQKRQVTVSKGEIPKQINGVYYKNGPYRVNFGQQIVPHWFYSTGGILQLRIQNGVAQSQYRMVETQTNLQRQKSKTFIDTKQQNVISNLMKIDGFLTGNTSVLPLKNVNYFLAVSQGGPPIKIEKDTLQCLGHDDFGVIRKGFSAHAKVDPDTGDIYNICAQPPNTALRKFKKDMTPLQYQPINLRNIQSIHDFCLAGQYIIFFQCPNVPEQSVSITKKPAAIFGKFKPQLPTLVHVHRKTDLKEVNVIQAQPFHIYHFTNGYCNRQEIIVQYCKYDKKQASQMFLWLQNITLLNSGIGRHHPHSSNLEEMIINLKDFSIKYETKKISAEFPVFDQSLTGKYWEKSFFCQKSDPLMILYDKIGMFNRKTGKHLHTGRCEQSSFGQPIVIKGKNGNDFVLTVVTRLNKSFFEIYTAENLQLVCQMETPQLIPMLFHGKWDDLN